MFPKMFPDGNTGNILGNMGKMDVSCFLTLREKKQETWEK
jgi:hypothetical protein